MRIKILPKQSAIVNNQWLTEGKEAEVSKSLGLELIALNVAIEVESGNVLAKQEIEQPKQKEIDTKVDVAVDTLVPVKATKTPRTKSAAK